MYKVDNLETSNEDARSCLFLFLSVVQFNLSTVTIQRSGTIFTGNFVVFMAHVIGFLVPT